MSEGVKLIFPTISARMREVDGEKYIWDSLRKKWLLLTPEEWVRQHTIAWLIESKGIPALRISQEYPVNINGQHQRADIVVIDESAKPYLLVECKAPEVAIDNEVVMQAIRYNAVVQARYILLTNGLSLYCFEYADGKYRAVKKF
ncbi:MAG: type I restriction enzyme HsdR N-terminal domain-containing protein [Alistipes sp.]|nr:type I restriction enzyme HsdR N-terminal domain-containing protein [Alistipes sp.]